MKRKFTKLMAALALLVFTMPSLVAWGQTYSLATSLSVGDEVVLVNTGVTKELGSITTSGTTFGNAVDVSNSTPAGSNVLTVFAGSTEGSFAFKTSSNEEYLSWSSGNSLTTADEVSNASSWTVSFSEGVATIANVGTTARKLQYNSGSPRFACYTSTQTAVKLYKKESNAYSLFSMVTPEGAGTVTLSSTSLATGATATATAAPANSHFAFVSWSITGTGASLSSTSTNPTTVTMGTENATVTATFTEDPKYNITYNANYDGYTGDPVVVSNYAGESMTIAPYTTFLRTGYAITSWNTAAGGGGTSYSAGDSYTMTSDGLTLYAQWEESNETIDVLDHDFVGVTTSNYTAWSDKTGTSGAVYAGQSAGGDSNSGDCIQLRSNNNNSGIVTTASGGKVTKVVVTWNSVTSNGRTLNVYGKNAAYSAATDLYGDNAGNLLGTIIKGTSTELTINDDYEFIGLRSASGAMYLDQIQITWELDNDPAVTTLITINDENLNNDVSNNTNTNGGSLSATVFDNQNVAISGAIVTWESSNTDVATIDASTGAVTLVAVGTTTITANYAGVANVYKPSEQTYTLNVIDSYAPGGSHNPYTVAQAINAVDNSGNVTGVYVTGIVSNVDYYSSSNHYITYFISADGTTTSDQLEAYHGKGIGGADFTSIDDIQKGDVVVICGDLLLYNNTTYELAADNQLVSLVRKTIAVTPDAIDAPADGTTGSLTVATENMNITDLDEFDVQFYDALGEEIENLGWVTFGDFSGSGNSFSVEYTIASTTEARTAYFKVFTYTDEVFSNLVTVTQAAPISVEYYQYSINGVEGELFEVTQGTDITLAEGSDINETYVFVGWTTDASSFTNILPAGSSYTIDETVEFFAVYGKKSMATASMTIDKDTPNFPTSYGTANTFNEYTLNGKRFMIQQAYINGGKLQFRASGNNSGTGTIYNNESFGTISSIVLNYNTSDTNKNFTVIAGSEANPTEGTAIMPAFEEGGSEYTFDMSNGNYTYFVLTNGTGAGYLDNIIINYNSLVVSDYYTYVGFKNIAAYQGNGGYVLVASPASTTPEAVGMITDDLGAECTPETSTYDLYYFDQSQEGEEWQNYRQETFGLVPGQGYLYASKNGVDLTFAGTHYTGNGQITVAAGWNLVGNPFAVSATPNMPYYRLNTDGSALNASTESSAVNVMEGVFVLAASNNETVTFTTTAPSNNGEGVALNVSQNRGNVIDRAIVRFDEGQQLPKFQLFENSTKLYIPQGNQDFAVVRSAAEAEMPVSFKASENGTYTLAVETENVEMNYLHLIDNMTGMDVDLLQTPSYTFEAKTNDYTSRFRLVFSASDNGASTGSATFAYYNGSSWTVSNLGEATLQVVDVMGRTVSSETINGNATISLNQTPGVYMLRLVNGNSVKVQKVVVR